MEFKKFAESMYRHFNEMVKCADGLFEVGVSKEDIWNKYLESFPEGSNPLYRERTTHDCSSCKSFIVNLGRVVRIKDGKMVSVWDVDYGEISEPYRTVAEAMEIYVKSADIVSVYLTDQRTYGCQSNKHMEVDGTVITYNHLWGRLPKKFVTSSPASSIGSANSRAGVVERGLRELSLSAVDMVIELINEGSLYRGEEHLTSLQVFRTLKVNYDASDNKNLYAWEVSTVPHSDIRNTVIGTLLVDISNGEDIEKSVGSFESKVAPDNYKRPKALVTKRMVEDALKTIRDLGYEDSIKRRFAKLSDVTINNVIWAAGGANKVPDSLMDLVMGSDKIKRPAYKPSHGVEDIGIEDFINAVIPTAKDVEVMVTNKLVNNFVSLSAPEYPDTKPLFPWSNNFAWSYRGAVTDAITERVKRHGGGVDGKLRVSLAWHNSDDLDLHCIAPGGDHIYYRNKMGILDIDMNTGDNTNNVDPVENMNFNILEDGTYKFYVHKYTRRSTVNCGFSIQVAAGDIVINANHTEDLRDGKEVTCVLITVDNGSVKTISWNPILDSEERPKEIWGIRTLEFIPVISIMNSPNYWDDNNHGNKHYIFALQGCKNDEPIRGIYNEFLSGSLHKHRKVMEVLGSRTMCPVTEDQISGVGFSSTKKGEVIVRVDGKVYNVKF